MWLVTQDEPFSELSLLSLSFIVGETHNIKEEWLTILPIVNKDFKNLNILVNESIFDGRFWAEIVKVVKEFLCKQSFQSIKF